MRDFNKKPYDNGFSLLEMLVILAVIGIGMAIALPSFRAQEQERPEFFARQVMQAARTARLGAMTSGVMSTLELDAREGVIKSEKNAAIKLPQGLAFAARFGMTGATLQDRATIVFFPDGGSTGATIRFWSTKNSNHPSVLVTIDWLTGVATLSAGSAIEGE